MSGAEWLGSPFFAYLGGFVTGVLVAGLVASKDAKTERGSNGSGRSPEGPLPTA